MLRIKLEISYFDIVLYWIVDILIEDIKTIILILNFNIKVSRRKKTVTFIINCIFEISKMVLKIFIPFDSE